jgi:serine/threonine-protein kinase
MHLRVVKALGPAQESFYDLSVSAAGASPRIVGRYVLFEPIASGGMATVHFGKQIGEAGFSRTVAIKRLHENFVRDPQFTAMMVDEARLVSRIRHPNVVPTLDVVSLADQLFVVMEYVHGATLSSLRTRLWSERASVPSGMAAAIILDVLHGLHAAHEARSEKGTPLAIVHRDVSPQNIIIGVDGVSRVLDFGIAKAAGRFQSTNTGQIKGKLAYMAPEQLCGVALDRRVDVYAAGIVLWELLAGRRLFDADTYAQTMYKVLNASIEPPSAVVSGISSALDDVVMRALSRDPDARFSTAHDFAIALEATVPTIPRAREVGAWVVANAGAILDKRAAQVASIEATSGHWEAAPAAQIPRTTVDAHAETVTLYRAPSSPELPSTHASPAAIAASPLGDGISGLPRPLSPRRALVGLSVGVVLAFGAVALFLGRSRPAPTVPSVDTASVRPEASGPTVSAQPAVSEPNPSEVDAPAVTAWTNARPVAPPRQTNAPPRPSSCSQPFTIDANGVKVPKRYCFNVGPRAGK